MSAPKASPKRARACSSEECGDDVSLHHQLEQALFTGAMGVVLESLAKAGDAWDAADRAKLPHLHEWLPRARFVGLGRFALRFVTRARASPAAVVCAYVLLRRLCRAHRQPLITSTTAHRAFAICVSLGCKFCDDSALRNFDFAFLAGVPFPTYNELERGVLRALDFRVFVSPSEFVAARQALELVGLQHGVLGSRHVQQALRWQAAPFVGMRVDSEAVIEVGEDGSQRFSVHQRAPGHRHFRGRGGSTSEDDDPQSQKRPALGGACGKQEGRWDAGQQTRPRPAVSCV